MSPVKNRLSITGECWGQQEGKIILSGMAMTRPDPTALTIAGGSGRYMGSVFTAWPLFANVPFTSRFYIRYMHVYNTICSGGACC